MRPAKAALDVGSAFLRRADARLVIPEGAAKAPQYRLVKRFVDDVPGEHPAPVVTDHGLDVLFQDLGKLSRGVVPFCQPGRILTVPDQGVAADLHPMRDREIHNPVGLRKIEGLRIRTQRLPLHGVFRFQQVEFAGQSRGVSRFGEPLRAHRRTEQQVGVVGRVAERVLGCGRGKESQ